MPLLPADLLYGAAYRVIFERCNPDNCVSADDLAAIKNRAALIVTWAATQAPEIQAAYARAAPEIVKRAAGRLENNLREIQLLNARKSIPAPEF